MSVKKRFLDKLDSSKANSKSISTRKNELTYRIALICAALSLPYYFIFNYFNLNFAKLFVWPTVTIYIISIVLNKLNWHSLSKTVLVLGTTLSLFFYANILGANSGAQLLLFALVPLPLLLFEMKQTGWIVAGIGFPVISSFLLEFGHYSWSQHTEYITPTVLFYIHNFAMLTTFLLLILSAASYFVSNRGYEIQLERKNKELIQNNAQLAMANEELVHKAAMDKEMDTAREIQSTILPMEDPPIHGYHLDHIFIPAKHVSGDYYDYFPFSDTRVGIVVADIVGKGIPASLMMIAFKSLIHTIVEKGDTPTHVLEKMNTAIFQNKILSKYVPMIYGILDTKDHTFTYSNGGHEPAQFFAKDRIEELRIGGMPVGMFERNKYDEETIHLEENDRIVLFTDGLTDISNKEKKKMGIHGLKLLMTIHASIPDNTFSQQVTEKILSRFDGQAQTDDITMVSIRRNTLHQTS